MKKLIQGLLGVIILIYFAGFFISTPYYNWKYAKENGFVKWILLGGVVPTAKAIVWPYFTFEHFNDKSPVPDSLAQNISEPKIVDYVDNEYNFGLQFPSNWKMQKGTKNEIGEIRINIKGPDGGNIVVAVGNLCKSVSKEQYDGYSDKEILVKGLIENTIENVYKKSAREIKAKSMVVTNRQIIPCNVGIKFYISMGVNIDHENPMVFAGQHVIPFGKPYIVSFLMVSPLNKNAKERNQTLETIFNSFHIIGEKSING